MTEFLARERVERLRREAERHRLVRTLRQRGQHRPLFLRLANHIVGRRANRASIARGSTVVDLRDCPAAADACEPTTDDVPVGAR